jgi:hypothetical protein
MVRLGILILATLAGLYLLLSVFGAETIRRPRPAIPAVPDATVPQTPEAEPMAETVTEPLPVVPASQQTPQQVQHFPGPDLQPSPEYAGRTPTTPAPSAVTDEPAGPLVYITGNDVRFRAGPSTSDDVIGSLGRGETVEALGPTDADWVSIRDAQGRVGYISGQFLSNEVPD